MLEKLQEAAGHFSFIGPKDLLQLASIAQIKKFDKGETVIQPGDRNSGIHSVLSGLLRSYIVADNGEERTLIFTPEKKRIASLQAFLNDKPAEEYIVAVESTVAVIVDGKKLTELANKNLSLLRMQRDGMREMTNDIAQRLKFYTVYSPEQRYAEFCASYPNLEQRVKQKHLASFLGVTPQSLSRMRARMVTK